MLIIHGIYHLRSRRIAFRNDYCLSCQQSRRSFQIRTFDVAHVFWIPILPLGFWKRWICAACGRQPDVSARMRRPFKWAGLFVLLFLSVLTWAAQPPPDFGVGAWVIRIGAAVGVVLLLVHLLRTPKEPSRDEHLKAISPATDTICPFCGIQLLSLGSKCSCPVCGILRS